MSVPRIGLSSLQLANGRDIGLLGNGFEAEQEPNEKQRCRAKPTGTSPVGHFCTACLMFAIAAQ